MLNWHLECGTAGSYSVFRLRVSTDLVVVETRNIHHRYSVVDIPVELQVSVLPLLTILLSCSNRDSSKRDLNLRRLNDR